MHEIPMRYVAQSDSPISSQIISMASCLSLWTLVLDPDSSLSPEQSRYSTLFFDYGDPPKERSGRMFFCFSNNLKLRAAFLQEKQIVAPPGATTACRLVGVPPVLGDTLHLPEVQAEIEVYLRRLHDAWPCLRTGKSKERRHARELRRES